MRRILSTAVLTVTLAVGGCASIVRGSEEQISFVSEPPGARVQLSNGLSCAATPCDLKIARKDDFTATFSKDGFQSQDVRVTSHVSGTGAAVGAGNIVAGGVIGIGVDAYNGANLDHEPNPVSVRLAPLPSEKSERPRRRRDTPVS